MNNPRIIAIETSSRRGSVAAARGPELLTEETFPTDREHARELLPALDRLCRAQGWSPDEIAHCYVSIGPGSFTGLRVAVTFARHLALATGAKICAVPTLDAVAENCAALPDAPEHLAVVFDAKRGQVFAAVFARRGPCGTAVLGCVVAQPPSAVFAYDRIVEPCLIEPAALLATAPRPIAVVGEGIDHHRAAIEASGAALLDQTLWRPRAANVHRLGWGLAEQGRFTPARELVPFYLRRPEAEELWEKRHGGAQAPPPPP
jgi:tRNA threonylcarbamoyladenosine biosynthesis protein TsaB